MSFQEPEGLDQKVQTYRESQCRKLRDELIEICMPIVDDLTRRYRSRCNYDDIKGEAVLALVELTQNASTALQNNNLVAYLRCNIRNRVQAFVAKDRTAHIPGRTFRHKVAAGKLDRAVVSVVSMTSIGDHEELLAADDNLPLELTDALTLAIHTDTERRVIDLRTEGYKYMDIGAVLGISQGRVGQYIHNIEARFRQLYAI